MDAPAVRIWGVRKTWFRTVAFPLFLILACPPATIVLWMIVVHHGGSVADFLAQARWSEVPRPSFTAAGIILIWAALQLALLQLLPGKTLLGPTTPMGNRPRYKLNGVLAFVVTHAGLWAAAYPLGLFSPTIVYDHFGSILITLSLFALVFCGFLYWKGTTFPSTSDASRSGNPVFDYYWGVELHPSLGGVNLKQLFNCRIALMGWSAILLSFAAKQAQLHGHVSTSMLVSIGLQLVYIFKFFLWEGGYFHTLDIMHDRFGFYICWGVTAWLPCVYTLVGLYLVDHPADLPWPAAAALFALGLVAIAINYQADAQRQRFRASGGTAPIWGKPPRFIRASYTTGDGKVHEGLLLTSGWWGVARHFHYLPEIVLSLAWTLPAGFAQPLPYFYVVYLTILLVDRAGRDDVRCGQKYGRYWDEYRARVRWKIVPGVF